MNSAAQLSLDLLGLPADDEPTIRRSGRAKRLSIKVFFDGRAEVVVPSGFSDRAVARFVKEHRVWLLETRAAQQRRYPPIDRRQPETLFLRAVDEQWSLHRRYRDGKPLVVTLRPGSGPRLFDLCIDGDIAINEAAIRQRVRDVVIRRARKMFVAELVPLAEAMNSRFTRLQVRDQKTCWGSYSSRGTLSMNYAAIFLSHAEMRYLCAHELAHFHQMNHSRDFWRCVEHVIADARAVDKRLGGTHDVVPAWLWS